MKNILATVFVASSLVVSPGAQGQPPAAPGQEPTTQIQKPEPPTLGQQPPVTQLGKVTIGGCIQSAPPAAPAAGAPSTPVAPRFDLANAKVVSGGPVGTTGAAATATRYRLEGEEKTISPHLNHQVEITGTVSPAPSSAAGAAPMFKVESLKMIAAKCS
jgi:hypothetical protein